ncbi:helix-turn-helix transcriptional regulator [Streptomyces sp. ID05-04B]|uniref:helix-turn-helix transcriptional regulator n=1 Tax=Streptomyces sp. ID05-04B TaxID=3028661 RepID=UPI0029CA4C60|nr:helix-turn-helix transcriptional regulator [Streptomyces sp. ID05-04B]
MSALPVPPSRVRRARGRAVVLRTITVETYRAFLASSAATARGTGFPQGPSLAAVKEGWRAQLLGWGTNPEAGALRGVALVLLRQVSGASEDVAHLPEEPLADRRFASALADGDSVVAEWLGIAHVSAQLEQVLAHSLVDLQPQDHSAVLPPHGRPALSSAVRRAMAYCEDHAGDLVSVADMAAAARVSPRTLQDRFRTDLGTTPTAHLRRVRLDRVHQDLLRIADGSASGTVTDVAARWGFTHLGRFAAYYREAYGQVPSRTAERR